MTGEPIRQTKFATWMDPDAWMEKMEGPRWKKVLDEEATIVSRYTNQPAIQQRIPQFQISLQSVKDTIGGIDSFEAGPILVDWTTPFFKHWWWLGSAKKHEARDIFVTTDYVWTTRDIGDGAETFQLECWSAKTRSDKPVWTVGPVGPDIAVLNGKLFYLGVKNKLIYHELWCCDAATGKNRQKLYSETSGFVNLSLEKQPDQRLLFIKDNSQDLEIQQITVTGSSAGKVSLKKQSSRFPVPDDWILPVSGEYGIDFLWKEQGLLTVKQRGKKTLWKCFPNKSAVKLLHIPAGEIQPNPFSAWNGKVPLVVHVIQPSMGLGIYSFSGDKFSLTNPIQPTGAVTRRIHAYSRDGKEVSGILTHMATQTPTKLLVIGYGAYGISTPVGNVVNHWLPLLQSGWAIAHAFVRGGGDHTEEWAKEGRREGRKKTVADFCAIIRKAQDITNIPSYRTAIYGRSAGGLLMGATLSLVPTGKLMGAVYTEVPYVDELRTTTNKELPLTELEYNEFGAPSMRLEDFISVGQLSPADSATVIASPKVLVLTRTAENDSQVFAYESVKWIRRLRESAGGGAPKLCIVERDQGHFTPPDATIKQWALDMAILDAWFEQS